MKARAMMTEPFGGGTQPVPRQSRTNRNSGASSDAASASAVLSELAQQPSRRVACPRSQTDRRDGSPGADSRSVAPGHMTTNLSGCPADLRVDVADAIRGQRHDVRLLRTCG